MGSFLVIVVGVNCQSSIIVCFYYFDFFLWSVFSLRNVVVVN